jgi:hypothetical protein
LLLIDRLIGDVGCLHDIFLPDKGHLALLVVPEVGRREAGGPSGDRLLYRRLPHLVDRWLVQNRLLNRLLLQDRLLLLEWLLLLLLGGGTRVLRHLYADFLRLVGELGPALNVLFGKVAIEDTVLDQGDVALRRVAEPVKELESQVRHVLAGQEFCHISEDQVGVPEGALGHSPEKDALLEEVKERLVAIVALLHQIENPLLP